MDGDLRQRQRRAPLTAVLRAPPRPSTAPTNAVKRTSSVVDPTLHRVILCLASRRPSSTKGQVSSRAATAAAVAALISTVSRTSSA